VYGNPTITVEIRAQQRSVVLAEFASYQSVMVSQECRRLLQQYRPKAAIQAVSYNRAEDKMRPVKIAGVGPRQSCAAAKRSDASRAAVSFFGREGH
jgi:hypothetical protein